MEVNQHTFVGDRELRASAAVQGVHAVDDRHHWFDELEAVWERARTDLALADAHRAAGDQAASATAARAAAEVFSRLGAAGELAQATALAETVA